MGMAQGPGARERPGGARRHRRRRSAWCSAGAGGRRASTADGWLPAPSTCPMVQALERGDRIAGAGGPRGARTRACRLRRTPTRRGCWRRGCTSMQRRAGQGRGGARRGHASTTKDAGSRPDRAAAPRARADRPEARPTRRSPRSAMRPTPAPSPRAITRCAAMRYYAKGDKAGALAASTCSAQTADPRHRRPAADLKIGDLRALLRRRRRPRRQRPAAQPHATPARHDGRAPAAAGRRARGAGAGDRLLQGQETSTSRPSSRRCNRRCACSDVWSASVGEKKEAALRLGLGISIANGRVYAAGHQGDVVALELANGRVAWRTRTKTPLSGGTAASADLVVVGGSDGQLLALAAASGKMVWRVRLNGEVLAPAAISDTAHRGAHRRRQAARARAGGRPRAVERGAAGAAPVAARHCAPGDRGRGGAVRLRQRQGHGGQRQRWLGAVGSNRHAAARPHRARAAVRHRLRGRCGRLRRLYGRLPGPRRHAGARHRAGVVVARSLELPRPDAR